MSTENRIELNLPMQEYQRNAGLSASQLSAFIESPRRFYVAQSEGAAPRQTAAMNTGTCTHGLFFEGKSDHVVRPDTYGPENKKWNGNATECKEWTQRHAGKIVMSRNEADDLASAVGSIRNHAHVKSLGLFDGSWLFEVSAWGRCPRGKTLLRGRFDAVKLCDHTKIARVVDLKTTSDASTRAFGRTILARRYHIQAAMYRRLLALNGYTLAQYTLIAVDLVAPVLVNVRHLATEAIDFGDDQLQRDIELFLRCRSLGYWPDYTDSDPAAPGYIDLPAHVYGETDQLTGMTAATAH